MGIFLTLAVAKLIIASPAASRQIGASRFALVQVEDAAGKAFVDIDVDDFVVQEAGTSRDVLDVRVADYPVVVVLDNGASARGDFDSLRAAIARFVTRLGPRPVAIVTTAGAPKMIATFEDDRDVVLANLGEAAVDTGADAAPLRAAAMAADAIRATGALFSTLVVATASPIEVAGLPADETLAPIIDSRAVVHVVADVGRIGTNGGLFRTMTDQTHGTYAPIYTSASFQPALDRLAVRLTTELIVEYLVPPESKAIDVKIGVRLPGARVRGLGVAPR